MGPISAYIPCFNNAATLGQAIESIQALNLPVDELLVIDDGSSDGSQEIARSYKVPVLSHARNLGRGAVRARAMQELQHELVLCLDGNKTMCPNFTRDALVWFEEGKMAAVYGRIVQPAAHGVVERWRGRHLFRESKQTQLVRRASLITAGAMVSKSKVLSVGNYDPGLAHTEDRQLGERLLAAGLDVVCDPRLWVTSIVHNDLAQVLERYWRWNAGVAETVSWRHYAKQIAYSLKVMVKEDLLEGDPLSIPISVLAPHYQFWRSKLGS